MKTVLAALAALPLIVAADAHARPFAHPGGHGGETIVEDQRHILEAEWTMAQRAGGYLDPVSAVGHLLHGNLPHQQVTRVVSETDLTPDGRMPGGWHEPPARYTPAR